MPNQLPCFIIIGAMKCGTTTLWRYLSRHPDVYMVPNKEPEYFCDPEKYQLGEDWYESLFDGAEPGQFCGEASVGYTRGFSSDVVASRIHALLPGARLIYIMRNPIDRAFSHYAFNYKMHKIENIPTFEEAIREDESLLSTSMYAHHIRQYLKYFKRNQMLLLLMEDLTGNPQVMLEKVQDFLGLEHVDLYSDSAITANVAGDKLLRQKIRKNVFQIPGLRSVANLMPSSVKEKSFEMIRNSVISRNMLRQYKPPAMSENTRKELTDYFSQSNAELADFLGHELPDWL